MLTNEQKEKYARNIQLAHIGESGQERLLAARVLCLGAGGLGSAVLYYLAAAGVGTLAIADSERVEPSNLQRQLLHYASDLGRYKVDSAKEKLERLNPDIKIEAIKDRLDKNNAAGLIASCDFIVDATDNFNSKYAINDACVLGKKAFSHAGVLAMRGQVMTYTPGAACLRCFLPEAPSAPETAVEYGILGAAAGHIGTLQAIEAINFITTGKAGLQDKMLCFEALPYSYRIIELKKNSRCPACGNRQK